MSEPVEEPVAEAIEESSTIEQELADDYPAEDPFPEPIEEEVAEPVVAEDTIEPVAEEPVAEEPAADEPIAEETITEEPIAEAAQPAPVASSPSASISARVLEQDNNRSRLQIDAEFDQAWAYLTNNLQKSDVTIFARNKAAGRFSIGCAGLATEDVEVRKEGGWSFFVRKPTEDLEYCALQVVAKRGTTMCRY